MSNTLQVKRGTFGDLPTLTQGEIGYCTDTDEAFIGDGAVNHPLNIHYIECRLLDKDTAHTVVAGVGGEFRIPVAVTVLAVGVYVDTAGTGSVTTIDINEATSTILTTKLTIDATEKTSATADAAAVIGGAGPAIAADAILTFDIDVIGSTTAGKGLVVWLKVVF